MSAKATSHDAASREEDASGRLAAEYWACLLLRHCPGLGARTWKKILSCFTSAREALDARRSWRRMGLVDARQERASLSEKGEEAAEREYEAAREKHFSVLTWFDPRYPGLLKELPDPPILLYFLGDVSLLSGPCVALVGARSCSRYGYESALTIARDLSAAGVTVVSGLAHGIDRQAHLGGLSGVGGSIAALGTGLDLVYPDTNLDIWKDLAASGLILTEFGPKTPPAASNFPVRNRIISGLSLGVVVIEAAARSGSLITARLAMEQGREVFAMPGPTSLPTFRGCHDLINQGAYLAASAADILRELKPQLEAGLAVPHAAPAREPSRVVAAAPPSSASRVRAKTPPLLREAAPSASKSAPALAKKAVPPKAPPEKPDFSSLSGAERAVMDWLVTREWEHMDAIGRELGLQSGEVSRALLSLELGGLVRKRPGMYYSVSS